VTSRPVDISDIPDLLELGEISTTRELSKYLRIPEPTLDAWASRGGGPLFEKIGRHRRYHREDVRAWLTSRRHRSLSEDPSAA
jgi:excisionase family DNA binding protein